MEEPLFLAAYPYQNDLLTLPIKSVEHAVSWYSNAFGMFEVQRHTGAQPSVILERGGIRLGFAVNGGDAAQDGAAILVLDIHQAKVMLESNGVNTGDLQNDERGGQSYKAFFVIAPDSLCYYFHELIQDQK
ncbi:VOC family protein [Leucothrix arctica]|uniref:VOC family protein n=1 Tax=Leucothrix arctica TaxID=1481894 RepID=A0A317C9Z8_9GAMM|nr:VOC family protein [Leucothrix arctica]PWQ93190.1 VOC family protein [Leucothrix arctica]